jgi:hypothetical protein
MTKYLVALTAVLLLFSSCSQTFHKSRRKSKSPSYSSANGNSSKSIYSEYDYNSPSGLQGKESDKIGTFPQSGQQNIEMEKVQDDRKVIYNASLELHPANVDTANAALMRVAHRHGGYVMRTGPAMASIRVRSERLNDALSDIGRLGKVKDRKMWGDDVTEEYMDLDIRLDNMKKTRLRYLELLQKANDVEETLKVERELERLNREIDLIEGKLNRLSHLTEYSTIDVYYGSKPKPGILGYVFIGLYKGVKWLFVRG